MSKIYKKAQISGAIILGITLILTSRAAAFETGTIAQSQQEINTPVQESEIPEPSQVEDYGCLSGYGDRTYRGDRPLTRYEFAAALNACLNRVNQLLDNSTTNLVSKEELANTERQVETLKLELERLRDRLDGLDTK